MKYLNYNPHKFTTMPEENSDACAGADSKEPGWEPEDCYYLGSKAPRKTKRPGWYSVDDYFLDRQGALWYHTRYFVVSFNRIVFKKSSEYHFGRVIPAWERIRQ